MSTLANASDRIVTIVLIAGQALASLVVGALSLLFAMISDGCHGEPDDPMICGDAGGGLFFLGIGLEWLLLAGGVVTSIVLAARAASEGRRSWPAPFIGTCVGLLGIAAMIATVTVLAS